MKINIIILIFIFTETLSVFAEPPKLELKCLGVAIKRENTHVWGSSPVIGPDGKVHLYAAQWPRPTKDKFGGKTGDGKKTDWRVSSEIAHYVGDTPSGSFKFLRIAIPDQDEEFNAPHNPTIVHINGKFLLLFIVNSGDNTTQRIIMYVADDLSDNWRAAEGAEPDGTILRQSIDPKIWDHKSIRGNTNPSLIKHNGKYKLYFKGVLSLSKNKKDKHYTYGLALSDKLEGPYKKQPKCVTKGNYPLEDAYVFTYSDLVWMLSKDMIKDTSRGGLLWVSEDGMEFDYEKVTFGFHHLNHYIGKEKADKMIAYRGKVHGPLERPQILFKDGKPAYLYMATALGFPAPYGSCSYVFKMRFKSHIK